MKQTPRTEMKRLAIALVITGIVVAAIDVYCIVEYLKMRNIGWEVMFRTEQFHDYFMMALGVAYFCIIPSVVVICGSTARTIYKHLDDISDEKHDA